MKAIDFHVHLPLKEHNEFLGDLLEPAKKYFNIDIEVKDTKEVLDYMSSLGIERVVVLPIDCSTNLGRKIPNESVLSIKDDRVIKFVSVDPLKTNSLEELRSLLSNSEVFGVKFHPIAQNFHPLDERALRLYRLIDDKGLIALFHTGFTGIGAGIRTNFRLDYGRPIYFDEIAINFPNMKIVLAHFGWPWVDEAIAVALHKPNVYLDLSGWAPKYIPQTIWNFSKGKLQDKLLFGSDYPVIKPERWLREFNEIINIPNEIKEKILYKNAKKLLNI